MDSSCHYGKEEQKMNNENEKILPENLELNLSNFALFLSVMKHKAAYECAVRIMYTFTEQCQEIPGMELGDGTKKMFLNMSSKNGRPELVSLLQYMKETRLDNPEIVVKDSRIVELDAIVSEVKQSEEWEEVKMSILEIGLQKGMEQGLQQGIEQSKLDVARNLLDILSDEVIAQKVGIAVETVREIRRSAVLTENSSKEKVTDDND